MAKDPTKKEKEEHGETTVRAQTTLSFPRPVGRSNTKKSPKNKTPKGAAGVSPRARTPSPVVATGTNVHTTLPLKKNPAIADEPKVDSHDRTPASGVGSRSGKLLFTSKERSDPLSEVHNKGRSDRPSALGDYGMKSHDEANVTKDHSAENGTLVDRAHTDYVGPLIHELTHWVRDAPKA